MENGGSLGGTNNILHKSLQNEFTLTSTPLVKHKPPLGNISRPLIPSESKESLNNNNNSSTPRGCSTSISPSKHEEESIGRKTSMTSICTSKSSIADELLESSFTEWLSQKEDERKANKRETKEKEIQKEEQQTIKKTEREERARDVVMKWQQEKEKVIKENQKIELEKEREKKENEERLFEKVKQATESTQKWRQEKINELKEKSKQEKIKEQKLKAQKQEESQIQMIYAEKAFKIWKEKKDESLKLSLTKQNKENKNKLATELSTKQERRQQACSIYDAWKQTKDKQIQNTKQLYTYNPNPRLPPKGHKWTPARTLKYSYPADPSIDKTKSTSCDGKTSLIKKARAVQASTTAIQSSLEDTTVYSDYSFESDHSTSINEEEEKDSSEKETVDKLRTTGELKTVTVCCQTLSYWCTCNNTAESKGKKNEE